MRPLLKLSAVFLIAATPFAIPLAGSASAQVTVDLHALQALPDHPGPSRPARAAPSSTSAAAPLPAPAAVAKQQTPDAATPASPPPALPEAVPDTASINPIAPPAPLAGAAPPPPVSDKATTTVEATTVGLRLTFAAEQSDLSPESIGSIKELANKAPPSDDTAFNVRAYSPGKPDDPSTARRVSLSRAMAVRSALVADGVPSARIFVRAMGAQYGDGPPDRVDIDVTGSGSAAAR